MNILILSPFLPYPLSQGGKIRIFNIVKYLSKHGHKVTLACISDGISGYEALNDYCEDIIIVQKKPSNVLSLIKFLSGAEPFNYVKYADSEMRITLKDLKQKKSFDLVQIEFSMMWQYADIFKGIPVVLDAHNIEYEIIRAVGKTFHNPLKRAAYILEEKRLRELEERAWRESSLCFTVSEREREIISSTIGRPDKVVTIPNGVDLQRFVFQPKNQS